MNYYLTSKTNPEHVLHIGKSSYGWMFVFRAYVHPSDTISGHAITSEQAWHSEFEHGIIHDEYGASVSVNDFKQKVYEKSGDKIDEYHDWLDKETQSPFFNREFC